MGGLPIAGRVESSSTVDKQAKCDKKVNHLFQIAVATKLGNRKLP
jgi:hypothetical protein